MDHAEGDQANNQQDRHRAKQPAHQDTTHQAVISG
jgi:hypothetical protein